jgi:hypothetical protein
MPQATTEMGHGQTRPQTVCIQDHLSGSVRPMSTIAKTPTLLLIRATSLIRPIRITRLLRVGMMTVTHRLCVPSSSSVSETHLSPHCPLLLRQDDFVIVEDYFGADIDVKRTDRIVLDVLSRTSGHPMDGSRYLPLFQ